MYPFELLQLIQFLMVIFFTIFLVYGIYHSFKLSGTFIKREKEKNSFKLAALYMQSLYSADFLIMEM